MTVQPEISVQTILFLSANPKDTDRLRLDQELRDIKARLRLARQGNQFSLEQLPAVRPRDIGQAMLDVNPQIVHFSGHGEREVGLVFENEAGQSKLVDGTALAELFALFSDRLKCVVLNSCYSEIQAKAIAQYIPYVIGMPDAISDQGAIAFSVGFYGALGAGRDVEFAYKLGRSAARLEGVSENKAPILLRSETAIDAATNKVESFVENLWKLDYTTPSDYHSQLFKKYLPSCGFIVGTQGHSIQKWIIKRLSRDISHYLSSSSEIGFTSAGIKFISVTLGLREPFEGKRVVDSLWQQVAHYLTGGRSDISGSDSNELDDQSIISLVCSRAIHEPVFIVLSVTNYWIDLNPYIQDFLIPLMQGARDHHVKESLLGVFIYVVGDLQLINDMKDIHHIRPVRDLMKDLINEDIDTEWVGLIRLDDLHNISINDVRTWLSQRKMDEILEYIQRQKPGSTAFPPESAIRLICEAASLEFEAVGEYWKLEKAG